jgi:hypothetical protein
MQGVFPNLSGLAAKILNGLALAESKPQQVSGPSRIPQSNSDKRSHYILNLLLD